MSTPHPHQVEKKLAVQVYTEDRKKSAPGELTILEWDPQGRSKRAVKWAAMCFGAAVVSVPIPPIHWVLVPGFLIASPIVFFYLMNQKSVIQGGSATCPACNQPVALVRSKHEFPMSDLCDKCRTNLVIEPTSSASVG